MKSYDFKISKGLVYRVKLINLYFNKLVGYININFSRLKNHKYNTYVKIDLNTKKNNSFVDFEGYGFLSQLELKIYELLPYSFNSEYFKNMLLRLCDEYYEYTIRVVCLG